MPPSLKGRLYLASVSVVCHLLPVLLEAFFLAPNIGFLLADRAWFALKLPAFSPDSYIFLLPRDTKLIQRPPFTKPVVHLQSPWCQSHLWPSQKGISTIAILALPYELTPNYAIRIFTFIFLLARWVGLLTRGAILAAAPRKQLECCDLLWAFFLYISSTSFSISLMGCRIRDCIDWWTVGRNPMELFEWQVLYWYVNFGLFAFSVIATCIYIWIKGSMHYATIRQRLTRCPLTTLLVIIFGSTSFLSSLLVLLLSMFEPWAIAFWMTCPLLSLDLLCRRKFLSSPPPPGTEVQTSNANTCTHILDFQTDGEIHDFKRVGNSQLFVPAVGETNNLCDAIANTAPASSLEVPNRLGKSSPVSTGGVYSPLNPLSPEDRCCLVCLEQPCGIVIQPCGHCVLCRQCISRIMKTERDRLQSRLPPSGLLMCPLCRSEMEKLFELTQGLGVDCLASPSLRSGEEVNKHQAKVIWVAPRIKSPNVLVDCNSSRIVCSTNGQDHPTHGVGANETVCCVPPQLEVDLRSVPVNGNSADGGDQPSSVFASLTNQQ